MSTQGKVQIALGNSLTTGGVISNVATNEADIKLLREMASDVTGKTISPSEIYCKRASFDEGLVVDGDSIRLGDGVVSARNLVRSALLITDRAQIGNALIDGSKLDLGPSGELSALTANLGTMTTGQLSVGLGGVVIGDTTQGVSISGNVIRCIYGGKTTIQIDGSTGRVTMRDFELTGDSAPEGAIQKFDGGIQVGDYGQTLADQARIFPPSPTAPTSDMKPGDMWFDSDDNNKPYRYNGSSWVEIDLGVDAAMSAAAAAAAAAAHAQEAADGSVVVFWQTSAPTSGMKFGDIWIDTDYSGFPNTDYCIYRYEDSSGGSTGTLSWRQKPTNALGRAYLDAYIANGAASSAYALADGKSVVSYQASAPSSPDIGDMWVETDNNYKVWVYSGSAWVPVETAKSLSAIQPGGGVAVNSQQYITTIDMSSGIVVRSSSSTARTQMTSNGFAIYNSYGSLVVQADHVHGLWVSNKSTSPSVSERISCAYQSGSTDSEKGYLAGYSDRLCLVAIGSNKLSIFADDDVYVSSNDSDVYIVTPYTLNLGHSDAPFDKISLNGTVTIEVGGAPTQGSTATGYSYGSIRISPGGSIWIVGGDGKWDRIRTYVYNP